jgi:hypothetical protein
VNAFAPGTATAAGTGLRTALAVVRYMARFAGAVARPHRFRLPDRAARYSMPYRLLPFHERQWNELYARDPAAPRLPFSYAVQATSALFFEALGTLGVNFRHLLYLRHELTVLPGHATHLARGADYVVTGGLHEVVVLDRDRVAPVFDSVVTRADDGTPIVETRDYFCVKDVPACDLMRLSASPLVRRDATGEFAGLSKRQPRLGARPHESAPLAYPANAGWRFGVVSGDLNLIHINGLVARLFGHQRPFAQGLFTANHVLNALSARRPDAVSALAITFCRPAFLPQTARLTFDAGEHEVLAEDGHLLACGTHRFRG